MIDKQIQKAARARGITTVRALELATALSNPTARALWHGDFTRLDLASLDALCRALDCTPNDLIPYVPEGKTRRQGNGS